MTTLAQQWPQRAQKKEKKGYVNKASAFEATLRGFALECLLSLFFFFLL